MLPLAGSITGRVLRVSGVSIHGDIYFDLLIEPDAGAVPGAPAPEAGKVAALSVRVPRHAFDGGHPPEQGERVEAQFLMRQATGVRVLPRG
ncbi:MAG: hypothetical protein ACKVS8_14070 [Phycisphaerales bacterium]